MLHTFSVPVRYLRFFRSPFKWRGRCWRWPWIKGCCVVGRRFSQLPLRAEQPLPTINWKLMSRWCCATQRMVRITIVGCWLLVVACWFLLMWLDCDEKALWTTPSAHVSPKFCQFAGLLGLMKCGFNVCSMVANYTRVLFDFSSFPRFFS